MTINELNIKISTLFENDSDIDRMFERHIELGIKYITLIR